LSNKKSPKTLGDKFLDNKNKPGDGRANSLSTKLFY